MFRVPGSKLTLVYQKKDGLKIDYLYRDKADLVMTSILYSLSKIGTNGVLLNIDEFKMREVLDLVYTDSHCQKLKDSLEPYVQCFFI